MLNYSLGLTFKGKMPNSSSLVAMSMESISSFLSNLSISLCFIGFAPWDN